MIAARQCILRNCADNTFKNVQEHSRDQFRHSEHFGRKKTGRRCWQVTFRIRPGVNPDATTAWMSIEQAARVAGGLPKPFERSKAPQFPSFSLEVS